MKKHILSFALVAALISSITSSGCSSQKAAGTTDTVKKDTAQMPPPTMPADTTKKDTAKRDTVHR